MPNCSYPAESARMDLQAMNEIQIYIKEHPNATYKEVAHHIEWYWEKDNASMWMSEFILRSLENLVERSLTE